MSRAPIKVVLHELETFVAFNDVSVSFVHFVSQALFAQSAPIRGEHDALSA